MKLYIKQQIFTIGDHYDIYDEEGNAFYHVEGTIFTFLPKFKLLDLDGNELMLIERHFSFLPSFEVSQNGEICATINQNFAFLSSSFSVESNQGEFEIEGDIFAHDYMIYMDGNEFGTVHKEWMTFGDTYELEVFDINDAPLFVAMVIAIDNCIHNGNKK